MRGRESTAMEPADFRSVVQIAIRCGLRPQEAVPLVGRGFVNRIWRVRAEPEDAIVRLNLDRDAASALKEYRLEAWCYSALAEVGLAAPKVLGLGEHVDHAFLAYTYVPGTPGDEAEDRLKVWRQLGEWAAVVHHLVVPPEAWRLFPLRSSPTEDWAAQRHLNIVSLGPDDPLLALGIYDLGDVPWLQTMFAGIPDGPLGLCHGDLAPRNLILGDDGRTWLLDWGCASLHLTPHAEVEDVLRKHLLENEPDRAEWTAFASGYGSDGPTLLAEVGPFLVLKAFDLVRWAIDRCPERREEMTTRAIRIWDLWKGTNRDPGP
jgi:aminoglycoside phosphotransferase (APT) family kinase protein